MKEFLYSARFGYLIVGAQMSILMPAFAAGDWLIFFVSLAVAVITYRSVRGLDKA